MKSGIRTFEKRLQVRAVVFDGQNIGDIHEIAGEGGYALEWNPAEGRVEVKVGGAAVVPNEHVIVSDGGEVLALRRYAEFKEEFREITART